MPASLGSSIELISKDYEISKYRWFALSKGSNFKNQNPVIINNQV